MIAHLDQTAHLWRTYWATSRSVEARNALIEHYLPFVGKLAWRMHKHLGGTAEYDELHQNAILGLMSAVKGYRRGRGVKFQTYASSRIWGAMLDGVRDMDWVPRKERESNPENLRSMRSLQEVVDCGNDRFSEQTRLAFLSSRREPDPSRGVQAADFLSAVLRAVPEGRMRMILRLRFEGLTFPQIGRICGLGGSRVSQLFSQIRAIFKTKLGALADLKPEDRHPAAQLRSMRLKAGLTQQQLAGRLGISSRSLSSVECGRIVDPKVYQHYLDLVREALSGCR